MSAPTIKLASGRYFDLVNPDVAAVRITELAHALSHICRFTGHTAWHYSVAQHSVHVSHLVPPADALAGLLHDLAEAVLGDVSKPLKRLLPDYRALELRIEAQLLPRFGAPWPLPASVHQADAVMLVSEKRDLLPAHPDGAVCTDWPDLRPVVWRVEPWQPHHARRAFLDRFAELGGLA